MLFQKGCTRDWIMHDLKLPWDRLMSNIDSSRKLILVFSLNEDPR